jgi:hypothetical protein
MKANFTAALVPGSGPFRGNRVALLDGLVDRGSRCTVGSDWHGFEIGSGDWKRFFLARGRRLELGDRGLLRDNRGLAFLGQFLGSRVIVTEVVPLGALVHCESARDADRRHTADLARLSGSAPAASTSTTSAALGSGL